ncbi:MAG: hypothetical protein BM557_07395 [Flavobacterium sp. MedPE-SWcel]|uniref:hypothetical protein n=1 Tax=uncultured Flavobacterium sp. TaxID=165435 RepID=UPI000915686E|nr:hypothetical protein [uncultured Flavobacterium sp.]OIQ18034.1 MAG: hypothetical protein BM557_07395 [Flavobacterium sp. MedPE-SWcel]
MNIKVKALLYNLLGFAPIFWLASFLVSEFTNLTGFYVPLTGFVVATILAPKFQVVRYQGGEKIFMKWIFLKGVKEIK